MLGTVVNIFKVPDLRKKVLFTIALLVITRVGFHIAIPGFNQDEILAQGQRDTTGGFGRILEHLQMLSGGDLSKSNLFGLGIMPYITSSIILMLLGEVLPVLRKLRQEGQRGQKKIQEYTRYLTVLICVVQGMAVTTMFGKFAYPGMERLAVFFGILSLTAGTLFLMWIGEQIDEYGIGNGISLIIMIGIVSRMPTAVMMLWSQVDFTVGAGADKVGPAKLITLICSFVFVIAGAILITQGQRRIPIQQAKLMRGRRMYGGQRHYLPLRVNHGGVMPIIFASSFMMFPQAIIPALGNIGNLKGTVLFRELEAFFRMQSFTYNLMYVILIFLFAYFWTTVQFQPKEMAKNLRDSGSFIPGLRPGRRTAEYLETVMTRITYYGASFLAIIAVVPTIIAQGLRINWMVASFLGGTGLLIVVSVSLDLVQKIEASLLMHSYEGFSESGRIKGAFR